MASHLRRTEAGDTDAPSRSRGHAREERNPAASEVPAAEPGSTGKHARRPNSPVSTHGTDASVTGAFQRLDPSVTGSFATLPDDALRPIDAPAAIDDEGTPKPIDVGSRGSATFERIPPEMAARAVTRDTAAGVVSAARARREAGGAAMQGDDRRGGQEAGGRRLILAVVLAVVALAGILLAVRLLRPAPSETGGEEAGQTQAGPDGSVTSAGTTYELVDAGDGTHVLTARLEGASEPVNVAVINGDPACLLTYDGAIIIPESYADGTWDVIAYTPGGDALAAQVVDGEGAPVHGEGAITDAHIEGESLVVIDSSGTVTTIALGA